MSEAVGRDMETPMTTPMANVRTRADITEDPYPSHAQKKDSKPIVIQPR